MSGPSPTLPTHTITLTASELTRLVGPVVPHVSTDGVLPLLCAVLVRVRSGWVTAAATDRYRMAMQRVRPETPPDEGFAAVIPTAVLTRVRAVFKKSRQYDPVLTLSVTGEELTVRAADGLDGITSGVSMAFYLRERPASYPNLDKMIRDALTATAGDPRPLAVGPANLAAFKTGQPPNVHLNLTPGRDLKDPWLVQCGEDFVGMIAPVTDRTASERAGWLGLLDAPAAEEKAA